MLCYAMLCNAMPCYAILCHAMQYYAMLCTAHRYCINTAMANICVTRIYDRCIYLGFTYILESDIF
jgi:hypothetical protein